MSEAGDTAASLWAAGVRGLVVGAVAIGVGGALVSSHALLLGWLASFGLLAGGAALLEPVTRARPGAQRALAALGGWLAAWLGGEVAMRFLLSRVIGAPPEALSAPGAQGDLLGSVVWWGGPAFPLAACFAARTSGCAGWATLGAIALVVGVLYLPLWALSGASADAVVLVAAAAVALPIGVVVGDRVERGMPRRRGL